MAIAKILPARPEVTPEQGDTLLEVAFLMTAVDGRLADEELPAYREVAAWMLEGPLTDEDFDGLLERFSANVEQDAIEERVRTVAKRVPAALREATFKVAMALALVDEDPSPEEDQLVGILFESLGLSTERAEALAGEVRHAFS